MKTKRMVAAMAVAAVGILILTGYSFAADPATAAANRERRDMMRDMTKTLDLAPDQKAQIDKQRNVSMQAWKDLRGKMTAKRQELKSELERPELDNARINAIVADTKALMGEQLDLRVKRILEMKQILTPEQFKKLQEERSKEFEDFHKRMEESRD